MELRVQNVVRDFIALQHSAQQLGRFDAYGADQDGLTLYMSFSDLLDDGVVLFPTRLVDSIVVVCAPHRPVGRNHVHVEFVNIVKLGGFRLGRACHARQFLIKPEIILDRDRRQRLRLAIDLDAFFGFHRLVQTIAPPSARHLAAGELIDDYDFVILDHVLDIFLKQAVGAEQL